MMMTPITAWYLPGYDVSIDSLLKKRTSNSCSIYVDQKNKRTAKEQWSVMSQESATKWQETFRLH
jgi:hypothetical protein